VSHAVFVLQRICFCVLFVSYSLKKSIFDS
jgi:hypothetical protein